MNPSQPSQFDSELRRKTSSSVVWTIVRALSDQLFSFIVFVTLARLLTKADIGLFAIAYVFSEVGRVAATAGLTQIIARAERVDDRAVSTIFWTNVAIAVVFVLCVVAAAPAASRLLELPALTPVLQFLAVAIVINSLGATHLALRLREFGHKTVAVRSLVSGVIGGGMGVGAALLGFGVYSLVIQRLVTEITGAILAWRSYPWRPQLAFDWHEAKANLRFGGNIGLAQIANLFIVRVQDIFIGASLGAGAVGVYRVAWRSTEVFAIGAIQPFATVAVQTLSRLRAHQQSFVEAYASMIRLCSAISFPVLIGYSVTAQLLVPLIFGPKWQLAGEIGTLFGLMALPFTLNFFASPALSAMGNGSAQRSLAIVQLTTTAAFTWLLLPYGLWWVAAGYVARSYLTLPLQMVMLRKVTGITARQSAGAIAHPLAAAMVMGVTVSALVRTGWGATPLSLLAVIAFGAVLYMAILAIIAPDIRILLAARWTRFRAQP